MTQEAKILSIMGIVTAVIVIGAVLLLGKTSTTVDTTKVDPNNLKILVRDDSYKTATDSALVKVNLVEFSDFQCPACAAAEPGLKQVKETYKDQVNVIFRHFPLPQHTNGTKAAVAAEAAGEQGKFFEMGDKLYASQDEWGETQDPTSIFIRFAEELGLDTEKFKADLSSNKYTDKIKRDQTDGITLGVNSTPTFFISNEKVAGALSFAEFKSKIDPLLK